ncbi:hypothetical protein KJ953_02720 [Patescibacteria group bacterium]|nr:hypothetical protein [Patescibacteria group bacterium]
MTIFKLPILDLKIESEFRKIFNKVLLAEKLSFEGFTIKLFPEDFNHICYEYKRGGIYKEKFSLRRARRLLLIKEICDGSIPYILIHQITRDNKSVCVLCESAEFAMFLTPKTSDSGDYFRMGTIIAYGEKIESKIEKQKTNGNLIKKAKEVFNH